MRNTSIHPTYIHPHACLARSLGPPQGRGAAGAGRPALPGVSHLGVMLLCRGRAPLGGLWCVGRGGLWDGVGGRMHGRIYTFIHTDLSHPRPKWNPHPTKQIKHTHLRLPLPVVFLLLLLLLWLLLLLGRRLALGRRGRATLAPLGRHGGAAPLPVLLAAGGGRLLLMGFDVVEVGLVD